MTYKAHETIWLQVDPDGESCDPEQWSLEDDATWCKDQINPNDVKYIRADLVEAKLEAARAEIERLKTVPMKYRRMAFNAHLQDENAKLSKQLAAEQAKNAELLSIVWEANKYLDQTYADLIGNIGSEWLISRIVDHLSPSLSKALSQPSDTSALEALIKQAGEVMRERCAEVWMMGETHIHALPAVTLEDLK